MEKVILFFILIPVLGFLISLVIPSKNEAMLSKAVFTTVGIHFTGAILFVVYWLFNGHQTLNIPEVILFKSKEYEFLIDFYFDKITAVYLLVGAFLTFLVTTYSRTYLHRENGYKRFFNTIMFFYIGYSFTIFSGNFETLFIGWEILGICSFLLIAFYRDRYLPVKNALKVFSVYRIGDIGLILAMWASHHLWHENISFYKLNNSVLVHEHLESHTFIGAFIALMILIAAAAKSAQLPFSSWLPRAMEGPTPSSAIFYGSLSVHFGVFLLLRTFPFWEEQTSVRVLIVLLGLFTSIIATLIARVQSTVKSQIAYSSIAQIGLIFIEVALGFEKIALFHFAGNAFLRTYQLLVSPSSVTYLIRRQFYYFVPRQFTFEDSLPKKLEYSIYLLSLKEWNLDAFMSNVIWTPLKEIGKRIHFITVKRLIIMVSSIYVIALAMYLNEDRLPQQITHNLPAIFALIGLILVIKSYSERRSPGVGFLLIIMNHFWIALAISFNEHFDFEEIIFYISGILIAGIVGYIVLMKLKKAEDTINLNQFSGHVYEHRKLAFLFLLAAISITGFPITPSFIGEDLVFSHIHENQFLLAFYISSSYIIGGISMMRIYARLFLGPHIKTYHETPYKSS